MPARKNTEEMLYENLRQSLIGAGYSRDEVAINMLAIMNSLENNDLGNIAKCDIAGMIRKGLRVIRPTVGDVPGKPALFYPRAINTIFGNNNAGKTFFMEAVVIQELMKQHHVMWIDFEEFDPGPIAERLARLGVDVDLLEKYLDVYIPTGPIRQSYVDFWLTEAREKRTSLVVVDSLGEVLGRKNRNENFDGDVATTMDEIFRPIAAQGPAVVLIDHISKSSDGTSAAGSKRKGAAINGSAYFLEAIVPFSKNQAGTSRLTCAKSRHGDHERDAVQCMMDVTPALVHDDENDFMIVDEPLRIEFVDESQFVMDVVDDDQPAALATFEDALFKIMSDNVGPLRTKFLKHELHLKNVDASEAQIDEWCKTSNEVTLTKVGWQLTQAFISQNQI